MRPIALVWIAALLAGVARAEGPVGPQVLIEDSRVYVAPGLQFGANSQELSLTLGRSNVSDVVATTPVRRGGEWWAAGVRVNVVAERWSPVAVHGVVVASFGGWGWEWWPVGFEAAAGYGGGSGASYGIAGLSYIAGVTSRLELFVSGQTTLGTTGSRPPWISNWVAGLRYGFDVMTPTRRKVTREPMTDAR